MKKKVSYIELIRKNKEELLKDRVQLERIERRVDDRHMREAILEQKTNTAKAY